MAPRSSIAIGISGRRLRAVQVRDQSGGGLRIARVERATMPESVNPDDPAAVGEWLGSHLKAQGFARGRAVFAIPRDLVSIKRLTLPTTDRYELPDMVRLAMQRDLPFDPSHAVIDFVEVGSTDHDTTVLVAAIQQASVDRVRAIAKHARLKVDRISLRCLGLTSLMRAGIAVADHQNAILTVDVTTDAVEFTVISDGSVRFSRAAKVVLSDDAAESSAAIVTETRRSWMSYRIVEDAAEIGQAFVFGDTAIADELATEITDLMKVRVDVHNEHTRIDTDGIDVGTTWPLIGLLLESRLQQKTIDFANPTFAPDRGARRRLVAYGAAAVLFIAVALVAMLAFKQLSDMRSGYNDLLARINDAEPTFFAYERDHYRLEHLRRWRTSRVDWLAHFEQLAAQLPAHDQAVLDQVQGTLRFNGVDYNSRDNEWTAPAEIVLTVDGEAATQDIIDSLRRQLARNELYRMQPTGPDAAGGRRYPFPFKLSLRTAVTDPTVVAAGESADASAEETSDDGGDA